MRAGCMHPEPELPQGIDVLERGWLSSNTVVLTGAGEAAVIDSGYWTHAAQTCELVAAAIGELPVRSLLNTHLHSDHCGGNAALQQQHPGVQTWIPPGLAAAVRAWDPVALTYEPTGQFCPRFGFEEILQPGTSVSLAGRDWHVHAAPGHDVHSVVLFEPQTRTLVSADALWENGFGIVFLELEGQQAFDDVAGTFDLIESLRPHTIVPGHGSVFSDVGGALARARSRLAAYVADPRRHAAHAAKVLLKFKLLELQRAPLPEFVRWAENTAYLRLVHDLWFGAIEVREWLFTLIGELVRSGAANCDTDFIANA